MPEIVQDIGAYAGLASVVGLAVLSVLYFSQARDVKRLREWAGRAPERASEPGEPAAQAMPGRVAAQPQDTPATQGPPLVPGAAQPAAAQPAQAARATPPEGAPRPVHAAPQPVGAAAQGGAPSVPAGATAAAAAKAGAGPAVATQAGGGESRSSEAGAATTQSGEPEPDEEPGTDPGADADPDTDPETPGHDNSGAQAAAQPGAPAVPAPTNSVAAPASPAEPAASAGSRSPGGASPAAGGAGVPPGAPGGPPRPARPATPAGGRPSGAPLVPGGASSVATSPAARASAARRAPQHTQIIAPPQEPWHQRLFGSTRNLLLAIAGVLVLGIGVAFALSQFSSDDPEPGAGSAQERTPAGEEQPAGGDGEQAERRQQPAIDPATVTVAVLNGTTVPGLAQSLSDEVTRLGFDVGTVANSGDAEGQQRAESVILYANGSEREAAVVGRRLGIPQREPIDPATQGLAGDATVVVITGADRQ